MRSEGEVRDWLRKQWPGSVEWIEPGRGSSVGHADANLLSKNLRVPTECKFWQVVGGKLLWSIRPAQIRYHMMSAKAGRRTALLYARRSNGVSTLWVFGGHWCPLRKKDHEFIEQSLLVENGNSLLRIFQSEKFWKENQNVAVLRLGSLGASP